MFTHHAKIYLRDTDATGVLFFGEQLRLALEAFESFLMTRGINLSKIIEEADFLFPVVHVEADFFVSLRAGDSIEIILFAARIGTSSFTLDALFYNQEKVHVGKTRIVHVATARGTKRSTPIPLPLLNVLQELVQAE